MCFDTGGLDIKPDSGMLNMKKDMGGAATVLALAHMMMARGLKLRLRVLIPAVENSISGASFRPRDVYTSRKGLTVEIGNTDAEGRLILADALALADEEKPELIVDMATLTGAARVALGPELPPFFTDDDALAAELLRCAAAENDPLWRLPLWRPYEAMLDSKVADINNVGGGGRRHHRGAVPAPLRHARKPGCISTSSPGRRPPSRAGRKAANARRRARSTRCSPRAMAERTTAPAFDPRVTPARPDLAAKHLEARSRRRVSSKARPRGHRAAGAAAPRAAARRAARHRSAQGRARHRLRDQRGGLGLGPA